MSNIKFSNNLFLGKEELGRWNDFQISSYKNALSRLVKTFGFSKIEGQPFNDLKVIEGTTASTISILPGVAIDSDFNKIEVTSTLVDHFTIPNDGNKRVVYIKYATNNEEVGTVSIDAAGNLIGVGTKFLSVLRSTPLKASKIKFLNSSLNLLEYEVLSVLSDTTAKLNISSGILSAESGLKISVVGTFTPGINVTNGEKFPFNYDSFSVHLSLTPPSDLGLTSFILATVQRGGSISIEDRRDEYFLQFYDQNSLIPSNFDSPLLGVEKVIWGGGNFSDKSTSKILIGWAFRANEGNYSSSGNVITVNAGSGGVYKKVFDVVNDDFNGWNVVNDKGVISRVIDTRKTAPDTMQLDVDNLIGFSDSGGELFIFPPGDFINIFISPVNPLYQSLIIKYTFPVNIGNAFVECPYIGSEQISISCQVFDKNKISQKQLINNGNYLNETNFDSDGVFLDTAFASSALGGNILLIKNPDNHEDVKAWLTKPNRFFAIQKQNIGAIVENSSMLLEIGDDGNTFPVNIVTSGIKGIINKENGTIVNIVPNNDVLFIPSILTSDELNDGFIPIETPNALVVAVKKDEIISFIKMTTGWRLFVVPASKQLPTTTPPIGAVMAWTGTLSGNFDTTGRGVSESLAGWAIANGNNTTYDLRGKTIVGAINNIPSVGAPALTANVDPINGNPNYNLADQGGENKHQITLGELPAHTHDVNDPGHTHRTGQYDRLLRVTGTNTTPSADNSAGEPDVVTSAQIPESQTGISIDAVGNNESHENRMPFFALYYIQRIF